jgi:hypothetical protein
MKRTTDDELKIRHAVMNVMATALGFTGSDKAACMEMIDRRNAAVAAGRMKHLGRGQWAITREYFDAVIKNSR